jgi:very-short-patch-repair endonuclease
MEKECIKCHKVYSTVKKTQKFCSVECQHQSYRVPKVERVKCICLKCGEEFLKIPSKANEKYGKYCSRNCKDEHQKEIYLGEKNPSWNRIQPSEERELRSVIMKERWKDDTFKDKIKKGMIDSFKKNGVWPGTSEDSKMKRKVTMIKNYGISHNWIGKYGERKCDKTTLEIYGKSASDMLCEYTHYFNKKTDIEIIFENLLDEMNIQNQPKFRIYNENKDEFCFREYDFLIKNTNILIEVDGDYWHGNDKKFHPLSEFQEEIKRKDRIKEDFAKRNGYEVIRFWGSDIKKNINDIKDKIKKL